MKISTSPALERIVPVGKIVSRPALLLGVLLLAQVFGGISWLVLDQGTPFWDEAVFLNNASEYCTGANATGPLDYLRTSTFYPPAVAWSSCPMYAVSGGNVDVVRVTGLLFLLGTIAGTYALGVIATNRKWVGAMAAFLVGTYPIVFGEARFLLADVPTMLWSTVVLILLAKRRAMEPVRWGIMLGAALGAGLLTFWRFPIYVGVPVLVVFVQILVEVFRDRQRKEWLGVAALSAVIALLIAGPWYGSVITTLIGDLQDSLAAGAGEGDPGVVTWRSLVWYPLSFVNDQVGFVAAAVSSIVLAGMLRWSRVRVQDLISPGWWTTGLRLSALSLISGSVILLFLFNKDPRFPMPLLVPVAVITAAGLGEAVRLWPRIRRAGYALIAVSLANGVFLFLSLSFFGIPESPKSVQLGDHYLSFASARYHQARPPADRSACDDRDVVEVLGQVDGREPRIGILSDSNYWNYFNFPYWADWGMDGQDLIWLSPKSDLSSFDSLVFGGTWHTRLPPAGYRPAGTCTGYDGSRVSLHVSEALEQRKPVSLLLNADASTLGNWSAARAELDVEPGRVTSLSMAGPNASAETSFFFSEPVNLSSRSSVRLRWQLSRPDVAAFLVILEDIGGMKLVWDRTAAAEASPSPVSDDLSWPDEVLHSGFRTDAVIRFGLSVREPEPAVNPTLVIEEATLSISPPADGDDTVANFEELNIGTWTGSNTELLRSGRNVVSSSTAGADVWAETSYVLWTPIDLTSAPGIHLEWQLSDSNVRSFWIFLQDVEGNKLVWDLTSRAKAGTGPAGGVLSWADARIPEGFRLEAVSRLVVSVQEPDPPVHAIVTVYSDSVRLR
jgi:4-amino-4-deoxy-L-arabinose transferase-like glycosyltransferase